MKVKELMDYLAECPEDADVYMASEEEWDWIVDEVIWDEENNAIALLPPDETDEEDVPEENVMKVEELEAPAIKRERATPA